MSSPLVTEAQALLAQIDDNFSLIKREANKAIRALLRLEQLIHEWDESKRSLDAEQPAQTSAEKAGE